MVLIVILIGTISCTNVEAPLQESNPNEEGMSYEVNFNLTGDYTDVIETPLSRTIDDAPKKYYGINVFCMKTDGTENSYSHYAYGVFDNIADMKITLLGGYKYKFECTSAMEREDLFYIYTDDIYDDYISYPFNQYNGRDVNIYGTWFYECFNITKSLNNFNISQYDYLKGIQRGKTAVKNSYNYYTIKEYPRMDRFYGELTDFIPEEGGIANILMKRTAFGVKITVNGVPDGNLKWYINSLDAYGTCTGSDIEEFTTIYTFYHVRDCWQTDTYSQNFSISFTWERENGYEQYFSEDFTAKRNVMTTINVNLSGGANNTNLGIVEENTPMENEDINIDYDGGNMNDTPVNPEE